MHPPYPPITQLALFLALLHYATAVISTITITGNAHAAPTSSSYTSDSDFQSSMIQAHNFYRGEHNASNLSWNDTSAVYASNWANACVFKHSGGPTGENLAAGYQNASASVDAWGLEREKYNFKKPGFSEATGHFTQVVWRNTTSVGCGRRNCQGESGTPGWYVVCEYYPPGNVVGDDNQYFVDNVKPLTKGRDSDTVESGVTGDGAIHFVAGGLRWLVVVVVVAMGFAV